MAPEPETYTFNPPITVRGGDRIVFAWPDRPWESMDVPTAEVSGAGYAKQARPLRDDERAEWDAYHDEEAPDPSARIFPDIRWSEKTGPYVRLHSGTPYASYVEYGESPKPDPSMAHHTEDTPWPLSDDLREFQTRLGRAFEDQIALLMKKRQSYGSDNLTRDGAIGIVVRASDKLERLRHMIKAGTDTNVDGDSRTDAWQDLIGYGVLGLLHHYDERANAVIDRYSTKHDDANLSKAEQNAVEEASIVRVRERLVAEVHRRRDEEAAKAEDYARQCKLKEEQAAAGRMRQGTQQEVDALNHDGTIKWGALAEADARAADKIHTAVATYLSNGITFGELYNVVAAWCREGTSKDAWWIRAVRLVCTDVRSGNGPGDDGSQRFAALMKERNARLGMTAATRLPAHEHGTYEGGNNG